MPVTKTLLLTQQDNILYLIDVNTKDRWIDEASYQKRQNKYLGKVSQDDILI
jgi:hypothetical protein